MELKTKYNIGDDVYYISYATVYRECECCGQEIDDEIPDKVCKGTVIGINVQYGIYNNNDNKISEIHNYDICTIGNWYITRCSNLVYDTEEEAHAAFDKEIKEKENDA